MIENASFATALVLASGHELPGANQILEEALKPFIHQILEIQRIDLGGRTIIAMLVKIDPAHFDAISIDLETAGAKVGLDVAMEIT